MTTGLVLSYNEDTGLLEIRGLLTDEAGKPRGSAIARQDLEDAARSSVTYYALGRSNDPTFSSGGSRRNYVLLDFADIAQIDTGDNPSETFNSSIIFLHELKHVHGLKDPHRSLRDRMVRITGETVDHINRIRRQLGLPLRRSYFPQLDRARGYYLDFEDGPVYLPACSGSLSS